MATTTSGAFLQTKVAAPKQYVSRNIVDPGGNDYALRSLHRIIIPV